MGLSPTDKNDIVSLIQSTLKEFFGAYTGDFIQTFTEKVTTAILEVTNKVIEDHENKISELSNKNRELEAKIDSLQQYSRRNSVRIFGIPENNEEDIQEKVLEIFRENLKLEITADHVDACHRVGKRSTGSETKVNTRSTKSTKPQPPRGVIVKFVNHNYRQRVYDGKRCLKGTKIVIREDLTRDSLNLVKAACERFGEKNVWTYNGNVYASVSGKRCRIKSIDDLKHF